MALSKYSLLVTNWDGNGEPCQGSGWSPAKRRHTIIENIVKQVKPDIILVQEGISKVYKLVRNTLSERPMLFASDFNKEAGILYNCTKFTMINPVSDFFHINQSLLRKNMILADSQLYGRFKALVLIPKGPEPPFLVLSYHGRYNGVREEMRLCFLRDLLLLVVKYINAEGMPAIIAGDFNIFVNQKIVDDMTNNFPKGPNTNFLVVPYAPTGNRDKVIDHIIMSSTFEPDKACAIDAFKIISEKFSDVTESQWPIILDHDPIHSSFYSPCIYPSD